MNTLSTINGVKSFGEPSSIWSALPTLPATRIYVATVVNGGHVYTGNDNSSTNATHRYAAVLNNNTLAWNTLVNNKIENGSVRCYAQDVSRNIIYFGGEFTTINSITNNRIFNTNQTRMSTAGLNGACLTLACDSSRNLLYAGGSFTSAGGQTRNRIARWNGSIWEALGTGLNFTCFTITLDSSGNLYVGGGFTTANGITVQNIAFYNITSSTWSALGSGLNNMCRAIVFDSANNRLYVGGNFTTAGGVSASGIAMYNITTSTWSALGSDIGGGVNGSVYSIALSSTGKLYVGGSFSSAGGVTAANIAVWDTVTSTWSAMGTGVSGNFVYSISIDNSRKIVYVAGWFTNAGGVSVSSIAKWSGGNI